MVIAEAQALGLGADSILIGLLQPALYQAGLDWECSRMSVAGEHRFTRWCERAFQLLPSPPPRAQADLLLFQTPGNVHSVGPRFAAHVLGLRGLSVHCVVPAVPYQDMLSLARDARPRFIGFSCATPGVIPAALASIARLRTDLGQDLKPRFLLSGFAFRFGGGLELSFNESDVDVVRDFSYFDPFLG